MEVKENRPDACAASGTANSIYKDFSTDAPDIQEELTGPVLPDECAADIVSFCSEQTIAYDDLLEYLHAVRPEAGRWEYAGGILGVRSSVAWVIWDAQHFGVPQRRRRVFLVADFAGYSAIPILAIPDSVPGYSAPRRVPRQIAATLIGSSFAYAGRA